MTLRPGSGRLRIFDINEAKVRAYNRQLIISRVAIIFLAWVTSFLLVFPLVFPQPPLSADYIPISVLIAVALFLLAPLIALANMQQLWKRPPGSDKLEATNK